MFNISDNIEIEGIENVSASREHIKHCLWSNSRISRVNYRYFGKRVQRGSVILKTDYGDVMCKFDVENGWARSVKVWNMQK